MTTSARAVDTAAIAGRAVDYARLDVTDADATARLLDQLDRLTLFVANAGTVMAAPFLDITPEQWQRQLDRLPPRLHKHGADCNTGTNLNPNDDCWHHGTSSAAIIVANANQGNDFRGVTGVTLDSFQVYATPCGGLDEAAAVRGFQSAVAALDRVIVAEIQGAGDHASAIARAADAAFHAGAVVIAANGNFGPSPGTVNCPANAAGLSVLATSMFRPFSRSLVKAADKPPTVDSSPTFRLLRTPRPRVTRLTPPGESSPARAVRLPTRAVLPRCHATGSEGERAELIQARSTLI